MSEPQAIYEDENFLAVDKPAGLLVHEAGVVGHGPKTKSRAQKEPTLVDWLLKNYPEVKNVGDEPKTRPGIVHRLDRDTSGVLLVAKNQKYFEYLKSLFQTRKIKKVYLAVVFGKLVPRSGAIKKPIGLKSGTTKRSVYSPKLLKDATTEYKVKKYLETAEDGKVITNVIPQLWHNRSDVCKEKSGFAGRGSGPRCFSLVEVNPQTGRTHQIRVHFASVGHPVVGDRLYGPKRQPDWATRLMLHALSLEFIAHEGAALRIEAGLPEEFDHLIR